MVKKKEEKQRIEYISSPLEDIMSDRFGRY